MKLVMLLILGAIIYSLATGLYYLNKDKGSASVARALTWRIALSIGLLLFILLGARLGWISPNSITP
ncbi:MAG: twin transmembrane helix small protein [Pseudomonadota bacterium]